MLKIYIDVAEKFLAIPVISGLKTEKKNLQEQTKHIHNRNNDI